MLAINKLQGIMTRFFKIFKNPTVILMPSRLHSTVRFGSYKSDGKKRNDVDYCRKTTRVAKKPKSICYLSSRESWALFIAFEILERLLWEFFSHEKQKEDARGWMNMSCEKSQWRLSVTTVVVFVSKVTKAAKLRGERVKGTIMRRLVGERERERE